MANRSHNSPAHSLEAIQPSRGGWWWARSAWVATGLAVGLIFIRSLLVATAHSPTTDEQYHLYRGLALLGGIDIQEIWNDPPPGSALMALPVWLAGMAPQSVEQLSEPMIHARGSMQAVQWVIAGWKSLLMWPLLAVLFVWARELYGVGAAWLVVGLVTFEPTLAAVTGVATPDTLGVLGVVLAMYATWQAIEQPTRLRLIVTGIAWALAAVLKHTGSIVPFVAAVFMAIGWALQRRDERSRRSAVEADIVDRKPVAEMGLPRVIFRRITLCMVVAGGCLWAFTGFDISRPEQWGRHISTVYGEEWSIGADLVNGQMSRPIPAGMYVGSLVEAYNHGVGGHMNYFDGQVTMGAGLRYFPVVATYKIPIGYAVVGMVAAASLLWRRPERAELWIVGAAAIWVWFVMSSGITIGFRHMLPGYVFLLLLCSRAVAPATRNRDGPADHSRGNEWATTVARALAVVGWAAGAAHVTAAHPDCLSYVNRPDDDAYLVISDSNMDWGQSLKQLRRWLDENPADHRPLTVLNWMYEPNYIPAIVGDRATPLDPGAPLPEGGLIAISASWQVWYPQYRQLSQHTPLATLCGGAMRIYDLDAIQD